MMASVEFPAGYRREPLNRAHRRATFQCGEAAVDDWLATKALQHQAKHLSVTKVLVGARGQIAGYYTLATGQIDFGDLPSELAKKLPRRGLPVAILAWLGVSAEHQRQGLGERLVAQGLRDCYDAGQTLPFIGVILDCLNDRAKAFYQRWDFQEMPGHPYRLYLSTKQLTAMMEGP